MTYYIKVMKTQLLGMFRMWLPPWCLFKSSQLFGIDFISAPEQAEKAIRSIDMGYIVEKLSINDYMA